MQPLSDGHQLYDFGYALLGDQKLAETLALKSLCVAAADHTDNRGRFLCSLRRLWQQVSERTPRNFDSGRAQDDFLRVLTLPERAAIVARLVLKLPRADRLAVFEVSEAEENGLVAAALQKIAVMKGKNK